MSARNRRFTVDLSGVRLRRWKSEFLSIARLAWLEFEVRPEADGKTLLLQTAFYEPKGLLGLLYWYALYPMHGVIFSGLIRKVAQ